MAGYQVESPSIFVSYRNDDWSEEVLIDLTSRFREDLGPGMVYRDKDDLIGGEKWPDKLFGEAASSDATLVLIGPHWDGAAGKDNAGVTRAGGSRRIDDKSDPVHIEVRQALRSSTTATPVPVLVDLTEFPELPHRLAGLKDHHAPKVTMKGLETPDSVDYQHILVAIWSTVRDRAGGGTIVIGDCVAKVHLEQFLKEMKASSPSESRRLSQIGSGTLLVPRDFVASDDNVWKDAIVLVEHDHECPQLRGLLTALDAHAKFKTISLVGVGSLGTLAANAGLEIAAQVANSGETAYVGHPDASAFIGATTPEAASVPVGVTASAGVKIAAGVAAIGLVGGVTAAVVFDEGHAIEFASRNTLDASSDGEERFYPLGVPGDATVVLGQASPTNEQGDLGPDVEYVSRAVSLELPGEPAFDLGQVVLPTSAPAGILASEGTYSVGGIAASLPAGTMQGQGIEDYCYREDDPSEVVAGWRLTGDETEVAVRFVTRVESGEVKDEGLWVDVSGLAEREFLLDPEDTDLSRCPTGTKLDVSWGDGS